MMITPSQLRGNEHRSHAGDSTGGATLAGKVAIVTGGGRGLGSQIAQSLHAAGADLAICGRDIDVLTAAAQALDPTGSSVLPVACDITDEQAVADFSSAVLDRFGRIGLLVNNTGIPGPPPHCGNPLPTSGNRR
jgi:NAD(P)-dependent dehydrogenase (short-subunit alcohol dehydrogenase family)